MTNSNKARSRSWVHIPAGSDFPLQNMPFGIFRTQTARAGAALGDFVIDLGLLHHLGFFRHVGLPHETFNKSTLNDFFSLGKGTITAVRERLIELFSEGNEELKGRSDVIPHILIPANSVKMLMPVAVPNYTDFYSSEEHAFNVGSMFRDPQNALLPNWKHLPVGYHGRASSIVVSGTPVRRPSGQIKPVDSDRPVFSPSRKLDFELEMAFITCKETNPGNPLPIDNVFDCIAGFVLFNDWSARDIQQWEYVPLGPFLGKNFASTVSPWVVTLDALEPFRVEGPGQDPPVLPYLHASGKRNFDVFLEVQLKPDGGDAVTVCRSNMKYLYWSVEQQLAHHTVNGCNIQVGDMYASGTISGPTPDSFGSMLELSWNGKKAVPIGNGSARYFLEDGDTVIMKAYAEKDGTRIGFGECVGTVLPATINGGK